LGVTQQSIMSLSSVERVIADKNDHILVLKINLPSGMRSEELAWLKALGS
jgi:hypothetical protein